MIYCSIDIETTGLNPENCDILQFAAIIDNLSNPQPLENLPRFEAIFVKKEPYSGDPYALSMHPNLFRRIAEAQKNRLDKCPQTGAKFIEITDLPKALFEFFKENNLPITPSGRIYVTVAGKNLGSFDLPFLKSKIKNWGSVYFLQRVLDPAILYFDITQDAQLPDMQKCMERADLQGLVSHDAFDDALVVVQLLRKKLLTTKK